jgi:hypothetical protein
VQCYLRYQRDYVKRQSSNGSTAYDNARTRRMNALAQIEEMRSKQLAGEL